MIRFSSIELGAAVMNHGEELVCPGLRPGPRLRQPPYNSKKLPERLIDLYVSSVRVIPTGQGSWRLAIIGESAYCTEATSYICVLSLEFCR